MCRIVGYVGRKASSEVVVARHYIASRTAVMTPPAVAVIGEGRRVRKEGEQTRRLEPSPAKALSRDPAGIGHHPVGHPRRASRPCNTRIGDDGRICVIHSSIIENAPRRDGLLSAGVMPSSRTRRRDRCSPVQLFEVDRDLAAIPESVCPQWENCRYPSTARWDQAATTRTDRRADKTTSRCRFG